MVYRVADGGMHAKRRRPKQGSALRVSRELQGPVDGHSATPIAPLALSPHDILVCKDAMNEANALAAYPALARRVFRVGDVAAWSVTGAGGQPSLNGVLHYEREVRDPYGNSDDSTRDASALIPWLVAHWMVQARRRKAM